MNNSKNQKKESFAFVRREGKKDTEDFTTGFTIVETFVAISVLLVAIAGPLSLVTQSISASIFAKEQITASFLAQEAIEYIRNQRDTNILQGEDWLFDIDSDCALPDGCRIGVHAQNTAPCSGSCGPLWFNDSTGQYGYGIASGWNKTIFLRTVTVEEQEENEAEIVSTVSWETGMTSKSITVTGRIFNWD